MAAPPIEEQLFTDGMVDERCLCKCGGDKWQLQMNLQQLIFILYIHYIAYLTWLSDNLLA